MPTAPVEITQAEYEILEFISSHQTEHPDRKAVVNQFDPQRLCNQTVRLFGHLIQDGYLQCSDPKTGSGVRLTSRGEHARLAYKEARDKELKEHTDQKKQQRFSNKVAVASVLVPSVTFILGVIVEHYAGIVSLIASLF